MTLATRASLAPRGAEHKNVDVVAFGHALGDLRIEDIRAIAADLAAANESTAEEIRHLLEELQAMRARGALPAALQGLLAELESLRERAQAARAAAAPAPATSPAEGR